MATLTRRGWNEIGTEVAKRLGRDGDTAIWDSGAGTGRATYWVDFAYRMITLMWHHFELDDVDSSKTLSLDANSVALPASTFQVLGVRLKSGSTFKGRVTPERASFLLGRYDDTSGLPERYARLGDTLYFDRKADSSYTVEIFRYQEPTTPDFATSTAPETNRIFDEAIVLGAVYLGQTALWRGDLGDTTEQDLEAFLRRIVNPPLAAGPLLDTKDQPATDSFHGGVQG